MNDFFLVFSKAVAALELRCTYLFFSRFRRRGRLTFTLAADFPRLFSLFFLLHLLFLRLLTRAHLGGDATLRASTVSELNSVYLRRKLERTHRFFRARVLRIDVYEHERFAIATEARLEQIREFGVAVRDV